MPPRKSNGCLDWDAMIEEGENEHGATNVHVNGVTRNDNLMGPQDWSWGDTRDGKRFGPFRPEPDEGMAGMVTSETPKRRKRK